MDQPYAALAKELLEPQVYPINGDPGKPLDLPYDVTGWTLSMQMGVEATPITTPVTEQQRAALEKIAQATPPQAHLQGAGASFVFSSRPNASYQAVNETFAAGGTVAMGRDGTFIVSGIDRTKMAAISQRLAFPVSAVDKTTAAVTPIRKARVALYRPWVASIDEGWTRWILENYSFAPVNVYNTDLQAGHLRERFNALIIPDMSKNALLEGHKPGSVPGQYAGGIGEPGLDAIREFVSDGGTLIAFNNAAASLIDLLKLPVTNVLEGVKSDQFFCSGALLRVELRDPNRLEVAGLPRQPIVMFERGPAFEPKAAFQGAVLASYLRDRNPLESGYLLHPERIQGKAAALEVNYGKGRIYLFGFKPQWRGQSHGTYKFVFNVLYDYDLPATEAATARNPQAGRWTTLVESAHGDLEKLIAANRAFVNARGARAVDESQKLEQTIRQIQETRLVAIQDFRDQVEGRSSRQIAQYLAQWRSLLSDAKTKELPEDAADRLSALEKDVAASLGGPP